MFIAAVASRSELTDYIKTEAALKFEKVLSDVEYSFPLNSSDGTKDKAAFDEQFREKFGASAQPSANSDFICDGLVLLSAALSQCDADDLKCVSRFFKSTKNFTGLSGLVSLRDDGGNVRPYGMKTIRG